MQLFPGRKTISNSAEIQRIAALPRRQLDGAALVEPMTRFLRTPQGSWTLRPLQAQALYEMGRDRGFFGPLRVGSGKTLITLLSAGVLSAKMPILLLPAHLVEKTERERRELSRHWRIPTSTRILSYQMLGRAEHAKDLEFYKPDLVILDECHLAKNKRAGVTKRLIRYFREFPNTLCVAVSGTVMKDSLRDFAHIIRWCLKKNTPLPESEEELDLWCDAVDEKVNPFQRMAPGALTVFSGGREDLSSVRQGIQARILETPSVVGSTGDQVACSLYIQGHLYEVGPQTEQHFSTLRNLWELPTGWRISEAVEVWRHARELALGFHYEWDPQAPKAWLAARREWAVFVREILSHSRTLDTELQVVNAIDAGSLRTRLDEGKEKLAAWRAIKPTFTPNTIAVWHDYAPLEFCANWMQKGAGIVWCEHVLFAEALAKATGKPYFGAKGVDASGRPIESAQGAVIASIAANGTGRNLQAWSRNLITSVFTNAPQAEQLLGRTHRDGQTADQVINDIMLGCAEHYAGFERARAAARAQQDLLGHTQKLLIADVVFPPRPFESDRWLDMSERDD